MTERAPRRSAAGDVSVDARLLRSEHVQLRELAAVVDETGDDYEGLVGQLRGMVLDHLQHEQQALAHLDSQSLNDLCAPLRRAADLLDESADRRAEAADLVLRHCDAADVALHDDDDADEPG